MRTEEIVQALRCCVFGAPCQNCPEASNEHCMDDVHMFAADLIERLTAENAALRAKVLQWIDAKDRLPKAHDEYGWEHCIVTVFESNSSPFDEPSEREFVSTALFDAEQKIWHIGEYGTASLTLNALVGIEDAPLNGYCVTHWMPLPGTPEEGDFHEPET